MNDEELLDTARVQRGLGFKSPSAVSKMVKRGALDPIKKHRGVRGPFLFSRADVDRIKQERAS